MQNDHIIYGVHITDRLQNATQVQTILTEYGSNIKTRLGLHEVSETAAGANGMIIMEMAGDPAKCQEMLDKLNAITGVEAQKMIFAH